VTLLIGVVVIIFACTPAILANLDRIVGYNGLFFLPLGACIFIDYWIFPKIGLQSCYAERAGLPVNWPAALTWAGALLFSLFAYGKDHYPMIESLLAGRLPAWLDGYRPDLFYLVLPEWIVAISLYIVFSAVGQKWVRRADLQPSTTPAR